MRHGSVGARGPGRPRDPTAGDAILSATLEILTENGLAGLTTDAIAARAGVSKATIYRRWSTKDAVVVAAVERLSQRVPVPNTGTLRGDLTAIANALRAIFAGRDMARLVSAIIAQMSLQPALAEAMRSGFLAERRSAARTALKRGRERGEVRPDIDLDTAVDLIAAPFYYRLLVSGGTLDESLAHTVVDAILTWVAPRETRG